MVDDVDSDPQTPELEISVVTEMEEEEEDGPVARSAIRYKKIIAWYSIDIYVNHSSLIANNGQDYSRKS